MLWCCWYLNYREGRRGHYSVSELASMIFILDLSTIQHSQLSCSGLFVSKYPHMSIINKMIGHHHKGKSPHICICTAHSEWLWLLTSNWMLMWVLNEARLPVVHHGICKWPLIIKKKSQMGGTYMKLSTLHSYHIPCEIDIYRHIRLV